MDRSGARLTKARVTVQPFDLPIYGRIVMSSLLSRSTVVRDCAEKHEIYARAESKSTGSSSDPAGSTPFQ